MSKFDDKTRQMIAEYHHYQGDGHAIPVKRIHHPGGGNVILVHFLTYEGFKYSSLDMIAHGRDGEYVTELFGCKRENENDMIQTYLEL